MVLQFENKKKTSRQAEKWLKAGNSHPAGEIIIHHHQWHTAAKQIMLARLARCSCNLKLKQHAAQGAALKLSHFLLPSAGWFGFPSRVLRLRPEQVLTINCPLSFFTFWDDVGRVVVSERVRKVRLIFVLEGGVVVLL